MTNLTDLAEWRALVEHQGDIASTKMQVWFYENPNRFTEFSLKVGGLLLDYSKNRIDKATIYLLTQLAKAIGIQETVEKLFSGALINTSQKRPALHMALRDRSQQNLLVQGQNIKPLITAVQNKMGEFVTKIHHGEWRGVTNKPIKHIVNIGIGGSYLGPMMCIQALKDFANKNLTAHFIASPDQTQLEEVLSEIDIEATLFIVSSKTFTTIETLTNAQRIFSLMQEKYGQASIKQHFLAATTAPQKAIEFGIPEENIFLLWDWVGGRYSVWSAIGLPLALMIGNTNFAEFLAGGYLMDQHFRQAPMQENMPIMLALLAMWYINFFGASAQAIAPYSYRLRYLVPYLQQAEMESSGKSVMHDGSPVNYTTGPVIFGDEGSMGQHAFHQLLLQGSHLIPVDFVLIGKSHNPENSFYQDILLASGISQAQALLRGKSYQEAKAELTSTLQFTPAEVDFLAQFKVISGNKPSNILFLDELTPKNLGSLLALYEHKIFVQSVLWNINPFDQWGVELAKELLPDILDTLQGEPPAEIPVEIKGIIDYCNKLRS